MPSVDVAMAQSLRGGVWETVRDSLARGVAAEMVRRDIISDASDKVNDFKTAISSWDNCMAANFCKWPVIAIIVVGGLILLGIVTCIVRCACCGMACCCSCFQCLKCCGNCCGCCDPPGGRRHKHLDEPYQLPQDQGYKTQAPMHAPMPAPMQSFPAVAPVPSGPQPPQYAEFDVSRKKDGEDSLPVMPSWDEGVTSKKALVTEEEVEMENLQKKPLQTEPTIPNVGGPSYAVPTSPIPMEHPTAYGQQGGAMRGYGQTDNGYGYGQAGGQVGGYAPVPMSGATPVGMRSQSPAQNFRGYGQNAMDPGFSQATTPVNDYGNQGMYGRIPQGPSPDGYGMQRRGTNDLNAPMRGQSPYNQARQSPAPQASRGYGAPGHNPPRDAFNRNYSPAPNRQYGSPSPRPMNNNRAPPTQHTYAQSPPQSPINNNSGFDFNSGYSRPQEYDRRPSESREPAGQEGYPGYKPYARAQDGWSGI